MANVIVTETSPVISVNVDSSVVSVTNTPTQINVATVAATDIAAVRQSFSATTISGFGNLSYANATGAFSLTGVSNAEIRSTLSAASPITYNSSTGEFGLEQSLANITLTQYQETLVNHGGASGNLTVDVANGTIHKFTLSGNVTKIAFDNIQTGGSATIILTQDGLGGSTLDTTTFPLEWAQWDFVNDFTDLDQNASAYNIINVLWDGSKYYASLVTDGQVDPDTLNVTGNITAGGYFIGDGSLLTNIPGHLTNAEVKTYIESTGLSATANLSTTANISGNFIIGDGSQLTNIPTLTNAQVKTYLESTGLSANADLSTNANVSGNYILGNGSLLTGLSAFNQNIVAGSGLTGGGSGDTVTLNVGAGTGIAVGADAIAINFAQFTTDNITEGTTNKYFTSTALQTELDSGTYRANISNLIINNSISGGFGGDVFVQNSDFVIFSEPNGPSTHRLKLSGNTEVYGVAGQGGLTFVASADATFTANSNIELSSSSYIIGDIQALNANVSAGNINATANISATGNVSGQWFVGNVDGQVNDISNFTTTDLTEGTNLYYTQGRFDSAFAAKTTSDLTEGTNLYYTDARVEAYLSGTTSTIIANTIQANAFIGGTFTGDGSDLNSVRAETVEELVINKSGGLLPKGTPVYATGNVTAQNLWVDACDASDPAKMPCIGVLATDLAIDEEGRAIITGKISGLDTSTFAPGDSIFVAVGGGYANVAPSGEDNIIQFLGTVTESGLAGGGVVKIAPPRNAEALNQGNIFLGDTNNVTRTVTPHTNFVTQGNVFELANSITDVNKVTSEASTAITLFGQTGVDVNKLVDSTESKVINLDTTGYSLQSADLGAANVTAMNIPALLVQGSATAGTNTMTMIKIIGGFTGSWIGVENGLTAGGTASYNTSGQGGTEPDFAAVIDNFLTDANKAGWIFFDIATNSTTSVLPPDAYVTGIVGNTVTFSENFLSTVNFGSQFGLNVGFSGAFLPGAFSTTQPIQYGLRADAGVPGGGSTMPFEAINQRMAQYNLPETLSNVTLDAVSYGDPTVDLANVSMRHIAELDVGPASAIKTPISILIGANATPDINSIGVDGILPTATKLGVTIEQDGDTTFGTLEDTPPVNLLFNNYANNSLASYTEYPIWTEFSGRSGNANVDMKYLGAPTVNFKQVGGSKSNQSAVTPETVVGRIAWQARSTTTNALNSGIDAFHPPASLSVRVNDADTNPLGTTANLDMYFQSTYSTSYRNGTDTTLGSIPRTFLASQAGNTVIAAKPDGKIMLKPVRDYGDAATPTSYVENRYAHELHEYHTFLSAQFADTGTKSGTIVTIQDASGETGGSTDFNYNSTGDATLRLNTHLANGDIKTYWDITNENIGGNLQISQDGNNRIEINGDHTVFTNIPVLPQHSNLSLPTSVIGGMIYVTNGNDKPAYGDGVNWYYYDGTQVL